MSPICLVESINTLNNKSLKSISIMRLQMTKHCLKPKPSSKGNCRWIERALFEACDCSLPAINHKISSEAGMNQPDHIRIPHCVALLSTGSTLVQYGDLSLNWRLLVREKSAILWYWDTDHLGFIEQSISLEHFSAVSVTFFGIGWISARDSISSQLWLGKG